MTTQMQAQASQSLLPFAASFISSFIDNPSLWLKTAHKVSPASTSEKIDQNTFFFLTQIVNNF